MVTPGGWHHGWNILATALLFQAGVYGLSLYSFTFWVDPWVTEFGASRGTLMLAVLFAQIAAGVLAPFAGRALDLYRIRSVVVGGLLVFGAGHAMLAAATAAWQVIVIYTAFTSVGLVAAGSMAGQTLMVKWFQARRGVALGWVATGTSIGGLLLPPLAAYLRLELGWRVACLLLGLGMLVIVVPVVWLVIRNPPESGSVGTVGSPPDDERIGDVTTLDVLRSRHFWALVLVLIPPLSAMNAVQMNLAPIALDLGIDAQRAAFMMSVLAGTMIAGKLFFGAMADRWDHRLLFLTSIGLMGAAIVTLTGQPGYPVLLLISALLGLAAGGFLPLIGATLGSAYGPSMFGRVRGLLGPFMTAGAVGAPIAGALRDATGSYQSVLSVFAASLVLAVIAIAVLMRPTRERATTLTPLPEKHPARH